MLCGDFVIGRGVVGGEEEDRMENMIRLFRFVLWIVEFGRVGRIRIGEGIWR